MSARHGPGRRSAAGFSLVELMIALSVMGLVAAAVFSTFFRSQKVGQTMATTVNLRQGARGACQLLERELRMAGSGWRRLAVYRYDGGVQDSVFGVNFGCGEPAACDSINLIGGWTAVTTLRTATGASLGTSLEVASASGFAVGDLIVLTDGAAAHQLQVTSVTASPAVLGIASSSTRNPPTGTTLNGWPSTGYGAGSQVYRTTSVSYLMDSTSFAKPSLVRRELGGAPQLVAYDVSRFQVLYRMQDGTQTRAPSDIAMVDEVVPMIWTTQATPGHATATDSVWAVVRPRTF